MEVTRFPEVSIFFAKLERALAEAQVEKRMADGVRTAHSGLELVAALTD